MTAKQKSPSGGSTSTTGKGFSQNANLQPTFYRNLQPTENTPDHASAAFIDAIRSHGLEPPDTTITPGRFRRFPGAGKQRSNRAGWCILLPDGLGGCFGDFSTGLSEIWQTRRSIPLSHAERERFNRQAAEARQRAEAERREEWEAAAKRATRIWRILRLPDPRHPYLIRKGINPPPETPVRQRGRSLVLPVTDFTRALTSLQFIAPDGGKRLLSGGRKQGCFIHVHGDTASPSRVIICEGWATGCTLAEGESKALVLAAIDSGNLEAVAMQARDHWPQAERVIAGDDDRQTPGNPGVTYARRAAIASDSLVALPQWPEGAPDGLTDFNDLVQWERGVRHG
uniref:Putative DNA primase/helicase n=1 Tax=Candidatus Kentrum sp. FW TaxID=2126338 RepID=A0A450SPR7_9GAMM|nr:MAG: putative DNA primase/helicase [Candidatus Kentron sp. FW]